MPKEGVRLLESQPSVALIERSECSAKVPRVTYCISTQLKTSRLFSTSCMPTNGISPSHHFLLLGNGQEVLFRNFCHSRDLVVHHELHIVVSNILSPMLTWGSTTTVVRGTIN